MNIKRQNVKQGPAMRPKIQGGVAQSTPKTMTSKKAAPAKPKKEMSPTTKKVIKRTAQIGAGAAAAGAGYQANENRKAAVKKRRENAKRKIN